MGKIKRACLLLVCFYIVAVPFTEAVDGASFESCLLNNGMIVLLRENHSNPMVASVITVDAGTYIEPPRVAGVSHLLEHLLFDGTAKRSRQEITEEIREIGGYINAFTRKDYTVFILLVPSEHFEEGLEIQADMLFHSIIPEEELAKERKVVAEEINRDISTIDYQLEKFEDWVFYNGTPYARPVLGGKNVISSITRREIIDYYKERYKPANMKAMIVGDFERNRATAALERYFGEISSPSPPIESAHHPERNNRIYIREFDTALTHVAINLGAPSLGSEDYYPFEVLCAVENRPGSVLKERLHGDGEIEIISSELRYEHYRGFSAVTLKIASRSSNIEKIVETSLEALREVSKGACSADALQRTKISLVTDEIYNEEKYHYYGMFKAEGLALAGARFLNTRIDRLRDVRLKDVKSVARKFFHDPKYKVAAALPKTSRSFLSRQKDKPIFDSWKTTEGMRFITRYDEGSRVFAVHLLIRNRLACEGEGRKGITEIVSRLLLKGTKEKNEETLDKAIQDIGAKIELTDNPYIPYDDYRTRKDYSFIRFQTIDDYHEQGLALLKEIVFDPAFREEDLEEVKSELKVLIAKRDQTPYKLARKLFFGRLFSEHPFCYDVLGEEKDIDSISLQDVRDFHLSYFSPGNIIATIVSNVRPKVLRKEIDQLFSLPGARTAGGCSFGLPKRVSGIFGVEKEIEASQNSICLGNVLPDIPNGRIGILTVMNGVLSERLGEELREKRGLAYTVGSTLYFGKGYGYLLVFVGTASENLEEARRKIIEVMQGMREGVTEMEVESYKNSYMGRALMRRLSRINQAYYMGVNEFHGFGYDFDDLFTHSIRQVTSNEVIEAARRYLPVEDHVIAVAGPLD